MRDEGRQIVLAMQFLTRLPMPQVAYSDALATASAKYYPLVGAVIGLVGGGVLSAASGLVPASVAVILSMMATLWLTGALHEDGLADLADGLGGGRDRDHALEIMRDSRVGSYGVIALICALGLKAALLLALFSLPVSLPGIVAVVIAAHGLSRLAAVGVIFTTGYARPDAGAKFPRPHIGPAGALVAAASGVLLVALLALWTSVFVAAVACGLSALATGLVRARLVRRLGGYTGDGLGAIQQMSELSIYLGVVLCL